MLSSALGKSHGSRETCHDSSTGSCGRGWMKVELSTWHVGGCRSRRRRPPRRDLRYIHCFFSETQREHAGIAASHRICRSRQGTHAIDTRVDCLADPEVSDVSLIVSDMACYNSAHAPFAFQGWYNLISTPGARETVGNNSPPFAFNCPGRSAVRTDSDAHSKTIKP